MLTKTIKTVLVSTTLSGVLFMTPVFAQSTTPSKGANQDQKISNLKTRGDTEVAKRITSLNDAISKINAAKRLTTDQKLALTTADQTSIGNLNSLKTKIDADTDLATLKTDVKAVFINNRIYMIVLPQTHIVGAADKIEDIVVDMNALATKLQDRITAAKAAGKDVTALQASLDDLKAKVADAQTQAQNAISAVTGLTPDLGDAAKIASNKAALETGRNDVKTGETDLKTARSDAESIVNGLKSMK